MEFDAKGIQSLYSSSDSYVEDLRPRLIGSDALERARAFQLQLGGTLIEKDKLGNAWNTLQDFLLQLDAEAQNQGLMGQPVRLFGESILMPRFEVDLATGVALISLMDAAQRKERLEREHLHPDELHGDFYGFTIRFEKTDGRDEETYTPRLAYQILFNKTHSPYVGATLFATGDVGVAQLEFEQDYKLDNTPDSLGYLLSIGTDETHRSVNLVNVTLAGTETHDATRLRCVGYHAEKILQNLSTDVSIPAQDALLDLTMHYVDNEARYKIVSPECALIEKGENGYTETFYADERSPFSFETGFDSFVFRPAALIKDGQVTRTDRMTMQLVLADKGKVIYVPVTKLKLFEKQ